MFRDGTVCMSPACKHIVWREKLHKLHAVNGTQFVYFTAYIIIFINFISRNPSCIEFACMSALPSEVFCSGDLLRAVRLAAIFNDSKEFVDRPLRANSTTVLQAFQAIPPGDVTAVRQFVLNWTEEAGSDLIKWVPPDWVER